MRLRYSTDSLTDAQTIAIWYECAEPGLNELFLTELMLAQIRIIGWKWKNGSPIDSPSERMYPSTDS